MKNLKICVRAKNMLIYVFINFSGFSKNCHISFSIDFFPLIHIFLSTWEMRGVLIIVKNTWKFWVSTMALINWRIEVRVLLELGWCEGGEWSCSVMETAKIHLNFPSSPYPLSITPYFMLHTLITLSYTCQLNKVTLLAQSSCFLILWLLTNRVDSRSFSDMFLNAIFLKYQWGILIRS